MNILIAHDGTEASSGILHDLPRAGLPIVGRLLVLCVAEDVPLGDVTGISLPGEFSGVSGAVEAVDEAAVARAEQTAARVTAAVAEVLPSWDVEARVVHGPPAGAIVGAARAWAADLVVAGTSGKGKFERWVLGSVSRAVVATAPCSVRLVRPARGGSGAGSPPRLMVAYDGSPDADRVVRAVGERTWPDGTRARLVTAVDAQIIQAIPVSATGAELREERVGLLRQFVADAERTLRGAGLEVTSHFDAGDAVHVLRRDADLWRPDCLFVGSRGLGPVTRFVMGSVSSALAGAAPCTVEVVRPGPTKSPAGLAPPAG